MNVTCSICIANYNGIGLIDECLASIRTQNIDFPIEIIVHDDASSDGSAEHLRANYPDIRLIESRENVGFCVANNRMAAVARGEYLLLLNNDVALFPDALAALLKEAVQIRRPAILSLPQYDAETGTLLDIGSLLDPFLNPIPNLDSSRSEVAMVMGACLWIPKALWDDLDGFPEWFGSVGEDLHLCCRARLAGCSVRALGHSGYRHRVGASFGGGKARAGKLSTTRRRRALSERNKTFVMLTCYSWSLLTIIFPLHLLLLHLEGLLLTIIRKDRTLWSEVYSPLMPALWRARKQVAKLRRSVQANRVVSLMTFLGSVRWMPWKLRLLVRHGLPEVR